LASEITFSPDFKSASLIDIFLFVPHYYNNKKGFRQGTHLIHLEPFLFIDTLSENDALELSSLTPR